MVLLKFCFLSKSDSNHSVLERYLRCPNDKFDATRVRERTWRQRISGLCRSTRFCRDKGSFRSNDLNELTFHEIIDEGRGLEERDGVEESAQRHMPRRWRDRFELKRGCTATKANAPTAFLRCVSIKMCVHKEAKLNNALLRRQGWRHTKWYVVNC